MIFEMKGIMISFVIIYVYSTPYLIIIIGMTQTYNTDYQVPDSAGTATAFLSGTSTTSVSYSFGNYVTDVTTLTVHTNKIICPVLKKHCHQAVLSLLRS
jgi:hypothetical protein